ncbi:MAG: DUF6291 domain-containing protein [Clostridia bacterium]|nr:DUF6291 domain-containing protein [Clostridia bacterium]
MKENDAFIFYKSFYEAVEKLPPKYQLEILKAVCLYALRGTETEKMSATAFSVFAAIRPQIDANEKKRERKNNGGAPRGNTNAKKQPMVESENNSKQPMVESENNSKQPMVELSETKNNSNNNDNNNDNVKEKEKENVNDNSNSNNNDNTISNDFSADAEKVKQPQIPYKQILSLWNSICAPAGIQSVKALSDARKEKIRIRIKEWGGPDAGLSKAEEIFRKIVASDFLTGKNEKGWRVTFDWIFNSPENWAKVYDGNYDNRDNKTGNRDPYKYANDDWDF